MKIVLLTLTLILFTFLSFANPIIEKPSQHNLPNNHIEFKIDGSIDYLLGEIKWIKKNKDLDSFSCTLIITVTDENQEVISFTTFEGDSCAKTARLAIAFLKKLR